MEAGAHLTLEAGEYRLAEPLGASSYGVVWRAIRQSDGLALALKLVNTTQMARAPAQLRGAWRAAAANESAFLRALAPWDLRHIVRLLDSGSHAGLPAIALELLGPDLGRHMAALRAAGRQLPPARVLAWLAQVNQALARVHAHGWHYLDLKPANLLLHPRDASLRLADFGTSRLRAAAPTVIYTGTPSWQAPEAFFPNPAGAYATCHRSDYFALGALFFYLVTSGETLAFCRTCAESWRVHGHAAAAVLRARGQAMPPTLLEDEARRFAALAGAAALDLLRTLLAPEPSGRPASALAISRMINLVNASGFASARVAA